jgi:hypothetical protein
MTCFLWPSLKPELTWDGLLTFVTGMLAFIAGLLAFFGIRSQIRHADEGLQHQLDQEKQRDADETKTENRALARALLTEIDHFYIGYVRTLRVTFGVLQPGQLSPLRSMPSEPFAIYRSCGAQIGHLPSSLVASVVRAYSGAQWLMDRVTDYREAFSMVKDEGLPNPKDQFARTLFAELPEIVKGAETTSFRSAQMLCEFLGVDFAAPDVALAELKTMNIAETNATTRTVTKQNAETN